MVALLCALLASSGSAAAQDSDAPTEVALEASAGPVSPAVVSREVDGRVTVRATRISEPLTLDGVLNEPVYATVQAIGGFLQQQPAEGDPATEQTDVWLLFDDRNIYVSARCWDSHPEREVANEMRRDAIGVFNNESFGISFDTFFDRRNAFVFVLGLAGGLIDGYITDERQLNRDWNTVWDAKTARFEEGWTFEIVIPFKSLRYRARSPQVWGVNFLRSVRWKNETSYLAQIAAAMGRRGMFKISSGARLVGIEPPRARRTFEVKPYGVSGVLTDVTAAPPVSNDPHGDVGFDLKLGLTRGLTADFTYNTDFAQVEEDEQQVNLSRLGTLFPEKREFFLEGQGIFGFGGLRSVPSGGGRGGGGAVPSPDSDNPQPRDIPILFFSRRIGLHEGSAVPIDVGARVTGRAGSYSIGLLDIQTGRDTHAGAEPTNFAVARIKRDILERSSVGVLMTRRSVATNGPGAGTTVGVDGAFAFYENLYVNTYLAKTETQGFGGDDLSYRAQLDYNGDRYGAQLEHASVGEDFNPEVGFLRRDAFRRNSGYFRFSPRPRSIQAIRKMTYEGKIDRITDRQGVLESREIRLTLRSQLESGDGFGVDFTHNYESLDESLTLTDELSIPPGVYRFPVARFLYAFGPQRRIVGAVQVDRGRFYDGTRTGLRISRPRVEITQQLSIEPVLSVNWIDVSVGTFTTTLLSTRTTYTLSPRMAVGALIQLNTAGNALNTNIRFRWEYEPGSDLFVVYSEGRDTLDAGVPRLENRGLVVKFTRLFRF